MNEENCLVVVGEQSGEDHALSFLPALQAQVPGLHFFGVGGDRLAALGMEITYHLRNFATMGFVNVLAKVPFYYWALHDLTKEAVRRQCRYAILVDFQDFNLRLAQRLAAVGIKVFYYVAPQAWVWRPGRTKVLAAAVEVLFTILPFEKSWFTERGVKQVVSVLHPLAAVYGQEIQQWRQGQVQAKIQNMPTAAKKRLLLLPGSRNQEVKSLLPLFMEVAQELQQIMPLEVSAVLSPSLHKKTSQMITDLAAQGRIDQVYGAGDLMAALKNAHVCLAASGTVTLACALMQVPTVICYKLSKLNELIYRCLVSYRGPIGLANIIRQELTFPEFLQEDACPAKIIPILRKWLNSPAEYQQIAERLHTTLSCLTGANEDAAAVMAAYFQRPREPQQESLRKP